MNKLFAALLIASLSLPLGTAAGLLAYSERIVRNLPGMMMIGLTVMVVMMVLSVVVFSWGCVLNRKPSET